MSKPEIDNLITINKVDGAVLSSTHGTYHISVVRNTALMICLALPEPVPLSAHLFPFTIDLIINGYPVYFIVIVTNLNNLHNNLQVVRIFGMERLGGRPSWATKDAIHRPCSQIWATKKPGTCKSRCSA